VYGRTKYGAKKTVVDGIKFDSKLEANRYVELLWLEKAGEIRNLQRQVPFVLMEKFNIRGKAIRAIKYYADFVYEEKPRDLMGAWKNIVDDSKGMELNDFKMKKKLFLDKFGEKYIFRLSTGSGNSDI